MALVIDTGPLLAALDAADPDHERCAGLLSETKEVGRTQRGRVGSAAALDDDQV